MSVARVVKRPIRLTPLEAKIALHIRAMRLPEPEWHYHWHPQRKFHSDAAWPQLGILLEAEGGATPFRDPRTGELVTGGGHRSITGFERDCEKYSEAAILGWVILRVTRRMVDAGDEIALIQRALLAAAQRRSIPVSAATTSANSLLLAPPPNKTKPAPKPVRATRRAKPCRAMSIVKGAAKTVK